MSGECELCRNHTLECICDEVDEKSTRYFLTIMTKEEWDEMIKPPNLPFNLDEKIFNYTDEEGNIIGEPYSYNDWIQKIIDMSGVNEELLCPYNKLNI